MSIGAVASAIVSVAKAVPIIKDLFDQITEKWLDYQISRMENNREEIRQERQALVRGIKNATSDSERIAFSRLLRKHEREVR